ncbi:hypothetical protein Hanom_Chr01g00003391 [Helianthus anomalus]
MTIELQLGWSCVSSETIGTTIVSQLRCQFVQTSTSSSIVVIIVGSLQNQV